ncbi:MAG: hypothetical protein ACI350_02940 [Prevotella sp.]
MKDILITRRRQLSEILIFVCCFIIGFALNVYAVIAYNAPWTELFTSLLYVLCFAVALYACLLFIRIVWALATVFLAGKFRKAKDKHTTTEN